MEDNLTEGFKEMYKERDFLELTQSFCISSLTTVDRLIIESADYFGVNASKYELCHLHKLKAAGKLQLSFKSLIEWKSWTIDKCIENLNMKEARFYLVKSNSALLDPARAEIVEESSERPVAKLPQVANTDDLVQREKILCTYHGVNVNKSET